ncbi:MAG TPA: hypothetical protein VKY89_14120 [Thermoanaerobaculia bacterium]|jgi:hypothetical protein|nr:hypothetical protein [Thermoanaerobaculia bacterium]
MISLTTYEIFISGTTSSYSFSGDIDSKTHKVTIVPNGAAVIQIELSVLDASSQPATFGPVPINFLPLPGPPAWVAWTLLSPTTILIMDLNFAKGEVPFLLTLADGTGIPIVRGGIDPTIVNTYGPPPVLDTAAATAGSAAAPRPAG